MMLWPEHDVRICDFSGLMKHPLLLPILLSWSRKNLMSAWGMMLERSLTQAKR
jgi:hypothetical protein